MLWSSSNVMVLIANCQKKNTEMHIFPGCKLISHCLTYIQRKDPFIGNKSTEHKYVLMGLHIFGSAKNIGAVRPTAGQNDVAGQECQIQHCTCLESGPTVKAWGPNSNLASENTVRWHFSSCPQISSRLPWYGNFVTYLLSVFICFLRRKNSAFVLWSMPIHHCQPYYCESCGF